MRGVDIHASEARLEVKEAASTRWPITWARTDMPSIAAVGPWVALASLILVFSLLNSRFFSVDNGLNIVRQASVLLVLGLAGTFIILMGSIDLSVGSVVSLTGMSGSMLVRDHGEAAILLVLLLAVACGAVNGALFAYGKLPSFLVTLGTLFALNGVTLYVSGGIAVVVQPGLTLASVFNGDIWRIPAIALWAVGLLGVCMFVSRRTRFGRYMFAIGGGETVAKLSGVPVARYKFYAFVVAGVLAGLGGILLMFRISGGDPAMGEPFLLPTIAAVVMGGTPLTGGVGGPHRTLLGVLIITILSNGMNLALVDPFLQNVVLGGVVILAVALTMDRRRISFVK